MKKRLLKKIVLGSVVTSSAAVATAILSTNFSSVNSTNQNQNTSPYKNIYTQNTTNFKKPIQIKKQNNSIPQMTPYTTAIPKMKVKFLGMKSPTSSSASDGEAYFNVENYNADAVDWTFDGYDGLSNARMTSSGNKVTISGMKVGENIKPVFVLKPGFSWNGPTMSPYCTSCPPNPPKFYGSIPKVTFSKVEKQPSTIRTSDGEVTYTLTNFVPSRMTVALVAGSNGTLGTYDPATQQIKVTGLSNGQHAQIVVSLIPSSKIAPANYIMGGALDDDQNTGRDMHKMSFEKSTTLTKPNANIFAFFGVMKSWKSSKINPGYIEILKNAQYSKNIKGMLKFDTTKNKWTYNGSAVDSKTNAATWTLDSQTSAGNPSQSKVSIWVDSYNKSTGQITLKERFEITKNGGGEDNAAITGMNFSNYTIAPQWNDQTSNPQKSSTFTAIQTYAGIAKPVWLQNTTQPTTSISTDGEVTHTFPNLDASKVNFSLASGSGGNLGNWDPNTKTIKVTGLWNGQHESIVLTPKPGESWDDGSTGPMSSPQWNATQTYVGLSKTTFSKVVKQPTTTTSTDGEVTFTLTNFDENKLGISLVSGSSGTLEAYNPATRTVKVTGLSNGQHAQISVSPKALPSNTPNPIAKRFTFPGSGIDDDPNPDPRMHNGYAGPNVTTQTLTVDNAQDLRYRFYLKGNNSSKAVQTYDEIEHSGAGSVWSNWITGLFHFDAASQKWTANGNSIESKANRVKWTQSVTSNTGGIQTFEFSMWVASFNKSTKQITFKSQIWFPHGTVFGEANGIVVGLSLDVMNLHRWTDGTTTPQTSTTFTPAQTYVGLAKTTFSKSVTQPKTTTSTDGEVTFTLTNFDETKMNIGLVAGSNGTLGTFDPATNTVKVTGLKVGQHAQIFVSMKTLPITTQSPPVTMIKKNKINSFGIEDDSGNSNPSMFWKDIAGGNTRNITLLASENTEVEFNSVLKSWKSGDINPTLANILSKGTFSQRVNGSLIFDSASQKWTSNGASIETRANALEFVLDSQTSAGNPSQSKLFVWVESFNKAAEQLNIKIELTMTVNGGGEDNAAFTDIIFTSKTKTKAAWTDGTIAHQTSTKFTPAQTYAGSKKPTFSNTTHNEFAEFKITGFNVNDMDVALAPGSGGTLGAYDPKTKKIQILNLANGQFAQLSITPKTGKVWLDGTTVPVLTAKVNFFDVTNINWTPTAALSGTTIAPAWSEQTLQKELKFIYSLTSTGTFKDKATFLADYAKAKTNVWHLSSNATSTSSLAHDFIWVKIASTDIVTGRNVVHKIPLSSLNRVINVDEVKSGIGAFASAHIRVSSSGTASNSESINWDSITDLKTYASNNDLVVNFIITNTATKPASTATGWSTTLPTTADFTASKRHLFIKFSLKANLPNTVAMTPVIMEITTSNLNDANTVKSAVDVSGLNLRGITATGTTKNFSLTNIPRIPTGAIVQFSYDDGTTWVTKAKFLTYVKAHPSERSRTKFKVRFFESNNHTFQLTDGSGARIDLHGNFDITKLFFYRDISTLKTSLSGTGGIALSGQLSSTDGVQVKIVDTKLLPANLDALGLKMQYSLASGVWLDVPSLTTIAPNTAVGLVGGPNSFLLTIKKQPTGNPFIKFRIIPFKDDLGTVKTVTAIGDYNQWVTATMTNLSDFISGNKSVPAVAVDKGAAAAALPTLVITLSSDLVGTDLSGDTRHLAVSTTIKGAKTPAQSVAASNSGTNAVFTSIKATYGILIGNQTIYFERADFMAWMNGTLVKNTTSGKVTNAAGQVIKVWYNTDEQQKDLQLVDWRPNWNSLVLTNFKAVWNSTDVLFRATDRTIVSIPASSVKKWVDLTSYENRLKALQITGQTNKLVSPDFTQIKNDLDSNFASGAFVIKSTAQLTIAGSVTTLDLSNAVSNALPGEINFDGHLGFRIELGVAGGNFVASHESDISATHVDVVWNKHTFPKIKKFVHTNKSDLVTGVQLSGNTHILASHVNPEITHSSKLGVMDVNGVVQGLEVHFKLVGVTGVNSDSMPWLVFKDWLAGKIHLKNGSTTILVDSRGTEVNKYGFNANNYKLHFDGTWGVANIKVQYFALPSFIIGTGQDSAMSLSVASRNQVARYVDLTTVITEAKKITVTGDSALDGWWDEATGTYNADPDNFGGYLDNKKLKWSVPTGAANSHLKVKIQYSVDNNVWTDKPPTSVVNTKASRNIYIKYVADGTYPDENGIALSDDTSHDITTSSRIQDVLTYVDINNVDLTKVKIVGLTNHIDRIETAAANIPAHSQLKLSISKFQVIDWSNTSSKISNIITALKAAGFTDQNFLGTKFKPSMTTTEFIAWINQLRTAHPQVQIKRSWIQLRVVADSGYSIRQTEINVKQTDTSATPAIVDELYTHQDVTALKDQIVFNNTSLNNSIGLFGQQSVTDGVAVSIPLALTEVELLKKGLKLQYTLDTVDGMVIDPHAEWTDSITTQIPANTKVGQPADITNGFIITVTPKSQKKSYLGFRLVPVQDDLGSAISNDMNAGGGSKTNHTIAWYQDDRHKKLFVNSTTVMPTSIKVDTSKIPTVINVVVADLDAIKIEGDSKRIVIHEDEDGFGPGTTPISDKADSHNTDQTLSDKLIANYSLDYSDGTSLTKTPNNKIVQSPSKSPVWLDKEAFTSYLDGKLLVGTTGTSITNIMTGSTISMKPTEQRKWIKARGAHTGDIIMPVYDDVKIQNVFTKWNSIDALYIPSDQKEWNIDITTNPATHKFRKWIDGNKFVEALKHVKVTGTTKSAADYQIGINNVNPVFKPLQSAHLTKLKLKLEYSNDRQTWSDTKFDYLRLSYAKQKDRKMYMRVVPQAFVVGSNNPRITDKKTDELILDYTNYNSPNVINKNYAELITTSKTSHVRDFKFWININKSELSSIAITGTSIKIIGDEKGVKDTTIDNDTDKYNDVTIMYLYDGKWVTKADLITKLQTLRDAFKFHNTGPWPTLPADFTHATVKAKWVVDNDQTAVMKTGQLDEMEIDKTLFKTWVNVWDLQARVKQTYTNIAGNKTMKFSDLIGGAGTDYDLTGTINKVGMSRKGGITSASTTAHNVVIQFTTKEFPDNSRNSTDWRPVNSLQNVVYDQMLNPKHKSLYMRFVGNQDVVASTQDSPNWGNGADILPIRIDISKLKYEIGVHSDDLKAIVMSGDTQSLFTSTVDDVFLKGLFKLENLAATSGIKYKTVDANGLEQVVAPANRAAWIQDVGLTVIFKATANRTKGKYTAKKEYTFNSYTEFLKALQEPAHSFNFDRSTLKLKWGVKPSKASGYQVSDTTWVAPTDVSNVKNVVYMADFITLTKTSINLFGNTILMKNQVKDVKLNNLPSGIKLQYTTDAPIKGALDPNASWTDTRPTSLPEHKHLWMRFAVTDKVNYKLGADTGMPNAAQVTLMDTAKVKTAISLDQAWMDTFTNSSVSGKTYAINWKDPIAVVPNSADGTKNGHVEFTVDGKLWYRALLETPTTPTNITAAISSFFNKSIASLIKDVHKLQIRYVIDKPVLFEFTDPQGNKRKDKTLTKKVDISGLIEPIITDQTDKNLPISSGSLHMNWKQFVASGKFKPSFIAGTLPKTASLSSMQFDGNDVDAKKNSFYKLDVNKFDAKDIQKRDLWNALAPRHAHFEFRTTNVDPKLNPNANIWSAWSITPPADTKTSTIFKGFEIKLVADAGYEIPSTDPKAPLAAQFGDQRFSSKYYVIIEKDVNGVTSDKVKFVGFHDTKHPSGTILTDNANGNFAVNQGEPQIKILNKAKKELSTVDWKAFVLEYNVKRNGVDVLWTDTANSSKKGWHEFAMAPDASVPWYGNYPKSLLNGDVIQYRLRARDGYLLLDKDPSLNRFRDKLGYVRKSHILGFTTVSDLKIAITIPPKTHIFNRDSLMDYWAKTIIDNVKMPSVKFGGNEGTGTVSFDMRRFAARNQVDIEVQVLYLTVGVKNQVNSMNVNQNPDEGYYVIDNNGQKHDVFYKKPRGGFPAGWLPDSELIPGTWVAPSKVKTLSVGDAIRIRFKAKPGFAFKWEDKKTTFTDILYPKSFSKPTYGMSSSSLLVPGMKGITPIPVRGLTVLPPTTPQKVTLVLSKELDKMLNRSALFHLSSNPSSNAKWKWSFTIMRTNGTIINDLDAIPTDLSNGDKVRVTIKTINASYKLEKKFSLALRPKTFTIQGLKDAIWVDEVAIPKMVFAGRVGSGSISNVIEASKHGERFDKTVSGLPKPVLPVAKRKGNKGVKWEFQVANSNPKNLSERELALLTWTDVPPTTLNAGQFIRMRLAPQDPTEVAIKGETATKKEILYSDDTIMVNGKPVKHKYGIGWVKIAGLKLNLEKIKLQHSVIGYKGKSTLQLSTLGQTLDDEGVDLEASYDGGKTWHDPSFFKVLDNTIFDPKTKKMVSNFLMFRAYAKKGYIIDPNDSDPTKGITVTVDPVTKKTYLYKDEWNKIKISGLKLFLNVSRLSISQIVQTGKYDGRGSFKIPKIIGLNTVVDKDGHKVDANGTPYTKFLKMRYVVRKIDPDTGEPLPSYVISDANKPPTGLYNGDSVLVEIFVDEDNDPSTESEYRLSNNQTSSLTIAGLIMKIPHVDKPIISFIGDKSGEGSPNVSPKAPSRTMWQYARAPKTDGPFVAPDPKTIKWLNEKPTDLFVGEHVMVRLVSSINQKEVIDSQTGKSVFSDWVRVSGLKETLDLSKLVIRAIDVNNPQDPGANDAQKIAFKIQGEKTGAASLVLNKNLNELLDVNGQKIPTPEALVWEFAVIDNVKTDGSYNQQRKNWSTAMPKNIKNNQRIWARLVIKGGSKYQNYKVVGFNEVSFVVQGLEVSAKIESKTALLVAMIVGVVATIGLGATIILIIKMRKRIKL